MKRIVVFCYLIIQTSLGFSQVAEHHLDTLLVFDKTGKPLEVTKTQSLQLQFSGISQTNLTNLMARQTPIFFKNYGIGSLATINLRGSAAHHTKLYLNGFELNSPMIGMYDYSLVQGGIADAAEVHYGGASLIDGHGGLGGSIVLHTLQPKQKQSIWINTEWSSLNEQKFSAGSHYQLKNNFGKVYFFKNSAQNNYKLPNNSLLSNAQLNQHGFLWSYYFYLSKKNSLTLTTLIQSSNRELPPALNAFSDDLQADKLLFSQVKFSSYQKLVQIDFKTGLVADLIEYRYQKTIPEKPTKTYAVKNQFRIKNNHEKLKIEAGLLHDYNFLISQFYSENKTRNRLQFITQFTANVFNNKLTFQLLNKAEVIDNFIQPFVPLIGFKHLIIKSINFNFYTNVSRNFHYPTLNDLYWVPGGNPNLKPEIGDSFEAGTSVNIKKQGYTLHASFNYFISRIDNWIQWEPTSSIIWKPQNLKLVQSSGVECSLHAQKNFSHFAIYVSHNFTIQEAINKSIYSLDRSTLNKQIIYTPNYLFNTSIGTQISNFNCKINWGFVGNRFVNAYNTVSLNSFSIFDAHINYQLHLKSQHQVTIQLGAENLLNTTYQVVLNRPMPPRIYRITLQLKFIKP